jgi:hypothetical protein
VAVVTIVKVAIGIALGLVLFGVATLIFAIQAFPG